MAVAPRRKYSPRLPREERREQLLDAVLGDQREQERVLTAIAAAMPTPPLSGDPAELLKAGFTAVLEAVRDNPDTWRLILLPADGTPRAVRAEVDRHRTRILHQLEPMVAWGAPRLGLGELDHELAAETILALVENAARLTLTQPRKYPPERIARFSSDLLATLTASG